MVGIVLPNVFVLRCGIREGDYHCFFEPAVCASFREGFLVDGTSHCRRSGHMGGSRSQAKICIKF